MESYSVLMSVYYKEQPEYLWQSIQSMLEQTVVTDDFVLVCDGPLTLELDAVIDRYQRDYPDVFNIIRLEENIGLGGALNAGFGYCRHELIARMDSDDIALPERCERQLAVFNTQNIDILSGWVEEFDKIPKDRSIIKKVPQTHQEILNYLKRRNPFNHPCVMYRKSIVQAVGGYQPFYLFEDYFLWCKMLQKGAVGYNIPLVLLYMRAGSEMYARRGGVKYAHSLLTFRFWMQRSKMITFGQYLYVGLGHALVALLPVGVRKVIYTKLLRN